MFQVVDVLFLLVTLANAADPRGPAKHCPVFHCPPPGLATPAHHRYRDGHAHDRQDHDPGHHEEGLHLVQLKKQKLPGAGKTAPNPGVVAVLAAVPRQSTILN